MSKLHVRGAGVDWDRAGVLELEHSSVCSSSSCTDGRLGEEERDEVQEGFWREVSEEAVLDVAWDLVGM